jgi:hypothetical protein
MRGYLAWYSVRLSTEPSLEDGNRFDPEEQKVEAVSEFEDLVGPAGHRVAQAGGRHAPEKAAATVRQISGALLSRLSSRQNHPCTALVTSYFSWPSANNAGKIPRPGVDNICRCTITPSADVSVSPTSVDSSGISYSTATVN